MSEKVAIFISEIMFTTHLGTGLEIIQTHLDKGDRVLNFICNSFLHVCDQNLVASPETCKFCIHKRKKGVALLSDKVEPIELLYKDIDYGYLEAGMSLADLKNIKHKDFDVGMAAASCLITYTRDAYVSVADHFRLLSEMINKSAGLYDFFVEELGKHRPDLVYVFNGRLIYDRALLRACEKLNIRYIVFDGAYDVSKYSLVENAMLHDITDFEKRAKDLWKMSPKTDKEKREIGEAYFLNSRYGSDKMRVYYVKDQADNLLPEGWDASLNNVVCFLSSEDEFAAIGDQWVMDLYANQVEGLKRISESLTAFAGTRMYVRIHPNSYNTNPAFIDSILALESEQVIIIPPDSQVSSYTLMLTANKVLAFGSSVGIEATFWNRPSINLGKSFYMNMGVCYNPRTHDEVMQLIQTAELAPMPKENTILYGYYLLDDGLNYKYYKPIDNRVGHFKGVYLHKYNFTRLSRFREIVRSVIPDGFLGIYRRLRYR